MPSTAMNNIERKVPMRVLCYGFPRTGTLSTRLALLQLGYSKCYHYYAWIENPSHSAVWKRAYEAKFNNNGTFTREDWDEILGDYQAITDNPCVYFAPELIAGYPEAKVILQTRDLDSWYSSFRATIVAFIQDPIFHYLSSLDEGMKQWRPVSRKLHLAVFNGNLEKENAVTVHQKSMDRVRELVPNGKMLEWKVQDGWGPLCEFLGVEEPETTFPRVSKSAEFAVMMGNLRRKLLLQATKRVGFWASALVMVGLGMWWAVHK